jgi:hypothetical protein
LHYHQHNERDVEEDRRDHQHRAAALSAQEVFFLCGDVPSNDLRRILGKTLFIRILGNYQAIALLGERGMEAETIF